MSGRIHSQASINKEDIANTLLCFKFQASADQIEKIREYTLLLLKWNKSISLTTIVAPVEIVARHFGEPIFAISILPVENCRLADIGTGAGFPGLALKIACPDLHVVLIEPSKKKCAFLHEVIRTLEFKNVEVKSSRFDEIRPAPDFAKIITARALGGFSDLLRWARIALSRRGHIVLWLGSEDSTMVSSEAGWIWQPAVRIPESQRRFILVGRPKRDSE
jgi:16S rRNA (guanine527-N7)-methyltransferase